MNTRLHLPPTLECIVKSHSMTLWNRQKKRNFFISFPWCFFGEGENDFWRREKAMNNNQLYIFPKSILRLSSLANIEKLFEISDFMWGSLFGKSIIREQPSDVFCRIMPHSFWLHLFTHSWESRWIHHLALRVPNENKRKETLAQVD